MPTDLFIRRTPTLPAKASAMSSEAFAVLGGNEIAYIKPTRSWALRWVRIQPLSPFAMLCL